MRIKFIRGPEKKLFSRRSFVKTTAALSLVTNFSDHLFRDPNYPIVSKEGKMKIEVNPGTLEVDTVSDIGIKISFDRAIKEGEKIGFALPESWSCQHYCPWVTKVPNIGKDLIISTEGVKFEFTKETLMRKDHQRKITAKIISGNIKEDQVIRIDLPGIRSTWLAEKALCRLWLNDEELSHVPVLTTTGKEHHTFRVIAPATVTEGEAFRVKIVSLDEFWNLSSSECHGILYVENGSPVKEISFKGNIDVDVPGKTKGVYRLMFNNEYSNAIIVTDSEEHIYFGDLHTHDKTHNCGCGEDAYGYARNISGLDFSALAPAGINTTKPWPDHVKKTEASNESGRFTTFAAFEHQKIFNSHHNVIYRDGLTSEFEYDQELLTKKCRDGKAFLIPHHTGVNWNYHKGFNKQLNDIIPLMEIYSVHGLCEYYSPEHILSYEFNRVRGGHNWASSVARPAFYRDALAEGCRYGLSASCDDHTGQPGKPINGVTGVIAGKNNREEIWQALKQRHTFATTGERIIMKFSLNGSLMGSETGVDGPQDVTASVSVYGTGSLAFVEIMKYGFRSKQWSRVFFQEMKAQAGFGPFNPLLDRDFSRDDITLNADEPSLFYMRVMQRTQFHNWPAFGWTSPVWVDFL